MLCDFTESESHCVCTKCGRKVVKSQFPCDRHFAKCGDTTTPPKPKVEPTNCIHFLGPTGDQTEAAKCGGCQTATAMTAVAECELHGLVTFIHRAKDEAFKCCKGCKDFEASP